MWCPVLMRFSFLAHNSDPSDTEKQKTIPCSFEILKFSPRVYLDFFPGLMSVDTCEKDT